MSVAIHCFKCNYSCNSDSTYKSHLYRQHKAWYKSQHKLALVTELSRRQTIIKNAGITIDETSSSSSSLISQLSNFINYRNNVREILQNVMTIQHYKSGNLAYAILHSLFDYNTGQLYMIVTDTTRKHFKLEDGSRIVIDSGGTLYNALLEPLAEIVKNLATEYEAKYCKSSEDKTRNLELQVAMNIRNTETWNKILLYLSKKLPNRVSTTIPADIQRQLLYSQSFNIPEFHVNQTAGLQYLNSTLNSDGIIHIQRLALDMLKNGEQNNFIVALTDNDRKFVVKLCGRPKQCAMLTEINFWNTVKNTLSLWLCSENVIAKEETWPAIAQRIYEAIREINTNSSELDRKIKMEIKLEKRRLESTVIVDEKDEIEKLKQERDALKKQLEEMKLQN